MCWWSARAGRCSSSASTCSVQRTRNSSRRRHRRSNVGLPRILDALRDAYPSSQVIGIDAPTTARTTYLAYMSRGPSFATVLLDASTAEVLGELPQHSWIHTLQQLHFNLLSARTGRLINGIGAGCLLMLCVSGAVIWWRGRGHWRSGFTVNFAAPWPRLLRELHGALGAWAFLMIAMWATTALSFTFPRQFRAAVSAVFPVTTTIAPSSDPAGARTRSATSWAAMIAGAQSLRPNRHIARVVMPTREHDPLQVFFVNEHPTPADAHTFDVVYVDRYSGRPLQQSASHTTTGDAILAWTRPIHVGGFGGGASTKLLWFTFGLMPALLFLTGVTSWLQNRSDRLRT